MSFVIWILLGGLLGRGSSALMGIRERPVIMWYVVVGIAGVMFAGWLLGGLTGTSVFSQGDYSLSALLVALMGATVLLGTVQLLRARFFHAATDYRNENIENPPPVVASTK